MSNQSRAEELLTALINGEEVEIEPRSRAEKYLNNCIKKCGCDDLPTPRTRIEALYYQLAEQLAGGGGSGESTDTLKALLDKTKSAYYLFNNYNGTNIDGLISYNTTSNVTNMSNMFYICNNLTSVPLLDTSNVTNMSNMFGGCTNLTSVPLFDTSNVTDMYNMFGGCTNLTSVPLLDTSNVTNMKRMFYGCRALTTVKLQGISSKITSSSNWFYTCTSLELIDFRGATGVPTLSSTDAFTNVPSTCKVVIPDDLYDTWTNATNWSAISVTWVKESEYMEE